MNNQPNTVNIDVNEALDRAIEEESLAWSKWERDPDFNNVNKRAYEQANAKRKLLMQKKGASLRIES